MGAYFVVTRVNSLKVLRCAATLVAAQLLFRPSARDRVALRRARESDLGYGDVTLIGVPSNGALLSYNLAYHILPENFFDDVST